MNLKENSLSLNTKEKIIDYLKDLRECIEDDMIITPEDRIAKIAKLDIIDLIIDDID